MAVNFPIKNAPDHVVAALRERARRNHRSLQGELMAIVEAAGQETSGLTAREALARAQSRGVATPAGSVSMLRADRDR